MKNIKLFSILFGLLFAVWLNAQENAGGAKRYPSIKIDTSAEHLARLREINRDIWDPFEKAYAAGDAEAYLRLHSADFIRATIRQVKDFTQAQADARRHFKLNRDNGHRCEIAFTFFERVAAPETASERGVYRYTSIAPDGARLDYFGQFHVFHRKTNGRWQIVVDYDSDEDQTIGVENFSAGLAPDVFTGPGK